MLIDPIRDTERESSLLVAQFCVGDSGSTILEVFPQCKDIREMPFVTVNK